MKSFYINCIVSVALIFVLTTIATAQKFDTENISIPQSLSNAEENYID